MSRVKTSKPARTEDDEPSEEPRRRLSGSRGKTAAAALVLLVGVAAAVVFRKRPEEAPAPAAKSEAPLVLREDSPPVQPKPAPTSHLVGRIDPLDHRGQPSPPPPSDWGTSDTATSGFRNASSTTNREAPPLLSSSYPAPSQASEAADESPPVRPAPAQLPASRTHRVRDGDTLSGLAREYLGDGELYMQIYELNRGVLKEGPDLLPIGAALKIPPADPSHRADDDSSQPQPLVPIPEGALRRDASTPDATRP